MAIRGRQQTERQVVRNGRRTYFLFFCDYSLTYFCFFCSAQNDADGNLEVVVLPQKIQTDDAMADGVVMNGNHLPKSKEHQV